MVGRLVWSFGTFLIPNYSMGLLKRNFKESGEFWRNRKGDLGGCGIFNRTGQNRLEAHTVKSVPISLVRPEVSHRGDDDSSLAEFNLISNRFVFAGSSLFLAGISGRENSQVFGGASHVMIKLIFSVHPGGGDVLHNRMIQLANIYLKGMPGTMSGRTIDTGDIRFVLKHFPFDTVPKIRGSPPQSDHFIVSIPVSKSIICGMD